jgi:hypothetical protein
MHLVGYLYEDYHDARSLEHKVRQICPSDRRGSAANTIDIATDILNGRSV